jgi:hypothetical protein
LTIGPLSQLSAPPIFVVGVHRSGTTWVYDMLTAHPEVAGVFESELFSTELGVAPLFHPGHWYTDPELLERHREFLGRPFRLNQLLSRDEVLDDVRALTARWLATGLEPHHRFLVEKTPQHLQTMRLISEIFPGALFIHVVRDGRDVAVSAEAAARCWPLPGVTRPKRRRAATRWARGVRAARKEAREGSIRYIEVRYEDLQRDAASELRRLLDFCGIAAADETIEAICAETAFESHGERGQSAFRRHGKVGEWRQRFGLLDRLIFDRAAGDLLVELGYEPSRRWWIPRFARKG